MSVHAQSRRQEARPRRSVIAAVISVLLALVLTATPLAATAAVPGASIRGLASGRCLDVVGISTAPGTRVQIYDCSTGANQKWTLTPAGELRTYDGTRCLDVAAHAKTSGARVQIFGCNGGANQRWAVGAGNSIRALESGLCLDVLNSATANNSLVSIWTCNGGGNQQWTRPVSSIDTQPPTVPGGPRVSGLTCSAVTFAWNASSDNVGVAFYDVFHDGQLMKTVGGSTLSTSLTVVAGAKWGLYVNARDAAGNVSQASTTVPIAVPQCQSDTTPPTAPGTPTATASGTSVSLSWATSADNIGVSGYEVYRDDARIATVAGASYVDAGRSVSTTYRYRVVAKDAAGNSSPSSATTTVTTGSGCSTPVCGVTQVAVEADVPWGLVTLPDGTILYARRSAHDVIHLDPKTGVKVNVGTVPNADNTGGEGGLLGLAIAPDFATNPWVYLMHTSPTDNRIVRMKYANNALDIASEQILLSGILRNKFHDGGRLVIGPDGKLYASTGDAQNGDYAQDLAGLNGKILRINTDGTIPGDNPFGTAVWSYGHRNPQGLAFDAQGRLWEQEFGNSVMDETNLIVTGGNYGWPACEGTSGSACGTAGFIAPQLTYPTADASCSGIAIVKGAIYIACARGERMYRAQISGTSLTNLTQYFVGTYGRLRTVEPAPDGGLWLTTTNYNAAEQILHVALGG